MEAKRRVLIFFFMCYPDAILKHTKKNILEGKEDAFLTVEGIKASHPYRQTLCISFFRVVIYTEKSLMILKGQICRRQG